MRHLVVAVICAASCTLAAPPIYVDCDLDKGQTQPLRQIALQQGAPAVVIVRPQVGGAWLDLAGVTGSITARPSLTSTNSVTGAHAWTSNATHQVAINIATTATASAVEWVYRLDLLHGGNTYPAGTGAYIVVERAIP